MSYNLLKENIISQGEKALHTPLRRQAMETLRGLELPRSKMEDWRYTNLESVQDWNFLFSSHTCLPIAPAKIESLAQKLGSEHYLVFLNGAYFESMSRVPQDFKVAIREEEPLLAETRDFFNLSNALFTEESLSLNIPDMTSLDSPLALICLATEEGRHTHHAPRLKIELGKFSKLTLIEAYFTEGDFTYFSNPYIEIKISEGAKLEHLLCQENGPRSIHIGKNLFTLKKDSQLSTFSFMKGSKLARQGFEVEHEEEGSTSKLKGLSLLRDEQLSDQFLLVNHKVGNTQSEQLFKGVLAGASHGVFTGKIIIPRNAQGVSATQLNNNLLLGEKAKMNTRPQLEIYADDVKCTHGATVGQLDSEQIFYLESRGIRRELATQMVTSAFSKQVFEEIGCEHMRSYFNERTLL